MRKIIIHKPCIQLVAALGLLAALPAGGFSAYAQILPIGAPTCPPNSSCIPGTPLVTQEVTEQEYAVVMRFWRKELCREHYTSQDFLRPDVKNEEHPLEIFVCAPWIGEAVQQAERNVGTAL